MRIAVLAGASLLLAGCAHGGGGETPPTTSSTSPPRPPTATSATTPSGAPSAGASVADVMTWVEAGRPAATAGYHSATRAGVSTELGDEIAFTTPSGPAEATTCSTTGDAVACLVDLADPPPRPPDVYGQWKGNWVDYDGASLQIGSAHGDPGPFLHGDGPELPYGATLTFGDYRCRADQAGLFCVNYAHRSAARFAAAGVEPFGCLHPVLPPPEGVGKEFSC